jgi:hypothetical protein
MRKQRRARMNLLRWQLQCRQQLLLLQHWAEAVCRAAQQQRQLIQLGPQSKSCDSAESWASIARAKPCATR